MSQWTTVIGAIVVETFSVSDAESIFITETLLRHLPKITGSERGIQTSVQLVQGSNYSSSYDELDRWCRHLYKTQGKVIITLYGRLRDRSYEQTLKETLNFLNRLSKRLSIESGTLKVEEDFGGREIDLLKNKHYINNFNQDNNWYEDYLKHINDFVNKE